MNTFQYSNCKGPFHYANCNCHQYLLLNVSTSIRTQNKRVDQRNIDYNHPKNVDVYIPISHANTKPNRLVYNTSIDTSNFTIEERLVAAVWVHERKRTRRSISKLRSDFRQRFGRASPTKNTLLVWECKLFSTGNVFDAPRSRRPSNRCNPMDKVTVSVHNLRKLSTSARALSLRVPRTTLRNVLCEYLNNKPFKNNDVGSCTSVGKDLGKMGKDMVKSSRINRKQSSLQHPLTTPHIHTNS